MKSTRTNGARWLLVSTMAAAVSICCIPQASGDDCWWTDPAGGLYSDPDNWDTITPPEGGDRAFFTLGGAPTYTVGFDANAVCDRVEVYSENDVTFDLNGHVYAINSDVQVGFWQDWAPHSDGFLTVTDGQLTVSGNLQVGDWDQGGSSLTIFGGGQVSAPWTSVYSSGGVTSVDGVGSSLTVSGQLRLGDSSSGATLLEITDHAAVSIGGGEFYGGIWVDGEGSTFTASNYVSIGGEWGYGLLKVTEGGTAELVGAEILGTTVTVDGAGSSVTFTDWAEIGDGDLEITNGGQLIAVNELDLTGDTIVTINGTDSFLTCGESVWLEDEAVVTITNGGRFTTVDLLIDDGSAVDVGNGGTFEVTGDLSMRESGLSLGNGSTCQIDGEMKIMSGELNMTNVTIAPELLLIFNTEMVGSGGVTAPFGGDASSTVTASGNLVLGDASRYDGFNQAGRLSVGAHGVRLNSKGFAGLGVLTELDGGTLTAPNGVAIGAGENLVGSGTVSGRVAAGFGSVIEATGDLAIGDAGALDGFVSDGVLVVADNTVTINDANQALLGSLTQLGTDVADGTLVADNGLVVEFGKNIAGRGLVDTPNDELLPLTNNGAIIGDSPGDAIELIGYVKGVGTFENVTFSGTVSPGLSPVRLHATNIEIAGSGKLVMELGGTSGGSEYDQLDVAGDLTLGGTLQVSLIDGFVPGLGDTFEILFGELNGTEFDAFELPELAGRNAWDTSALYSEGEISVIRMLDGDTDVDWDVDSVDLTNMAAVFGGDGDRYTDFNEDGFIDLTDFALMRANFGAGPGPLPGGGPGAATPEPASLVLMGAGLPVLLRLRRRRNV